MAYVPRERNKKVTLKIVIVLLCVVVAITSAVIIWYQNNTKQESTLMICGLNQEKTVEKLNHTFENIYPISDYLYYGESLDLFKKEYALHEKDEVSRKSIELINLCTEEKITYTMEAFIDRQIDISALEEGFYELYMNDNFVKKRIVYQEALESERFTTIKRDGKVKQARLLADKNIVHNKDLSLDQNYLFLEIKEEEANTSDVDVLIDPYGSFIDDGIELNGLKENEEMYQAALILKEQLENLGIRVMISKNDVDEEISYYGKEGRMHRAYESNARYYIELGVNASTNTRLRGTEIYHSAHASETFANAIMYEMKKHTDLIPSNAFVWEERSEGVVGGILIAGDHQEKIYDGIFTIRESGGRATGAAIINEDVRKNQDFAQSNHGMQAISMNLFYMSNEEDVNYWKEHKEEIMSELAKAFAKAVNIHE